ncbi:MAG TPA: MsnO8 family LLM class oxidoreductase [Saprospiraceae bacterium]|nr:MsnO8 family LLM class oxidoreductase [Saprospiraceae bacterium]
MHKIRLGILDLSPRKKNGTDAEAIHETIEVAIAADRLGYNRIWVSEHHNHEGLSNTSPELLMCRIAGMTSKIHVGSGGILLPNFSPLKVAEWIRTLVVFFPERIDIGIGRSTGGDPVTAQLLNPGYSIDNKSFEDAFTLLNDFLSDRSSIYFDAKAIAAHPRVLTKPDVWILSSGAESAALASKLGVPFSFAHFINPEQSLGILSQNQESNYNPKTNLAVMTVCAETEEEATALCLTMQYALFQIERRAADILLSKCIITNRKQ